MPIRQSKHCTGYGRAISPGKVTRNSLGVKKTVKDGHQYRPLPFALQVHPKALTPTPKHPDCDKKTLPQGGMMMTIAGELTHDDFLTGEGLIAPHLADGIPPYAVKCGEALLGYHVDLVFALAWRDAARIHGVFCDVFHQQED